MTSKINTEGLEFIPFSENRPKTSDGELYVMFNDGRISKAYVHENYYRTALMIKGEDGQYWRAMVEFPMSWCKVK